MLSFLLYIGGQLLAYAVDLGTFLTLNHLVADFLLPANILGKINAAIFAYFFHLLVSFRYKNASANAQSVLVYVILLAVNAALTSAILWVLVNATAYDERILKIVSDVICLPVTFLLVKNFVYRDAGQKVSSR